MGTVQCVCETTRVTMIKIICLFQGLVRNRIRRHLIVFAAAAPTMALVTYFGLSQVIIDIHIYLLTLYNST